jgi:4-hydroxy-3-polyprenylbenzoate decarboxylase
VPTWLLISTHGWRLLAEECEIKDEASLRKATGQWDCVRLFNDADRGAQPASGSVQTLGMVVCPCSMGTMAAIAHGTSRSLIERAADVTLKERRKLVLVPRETPLSLVHLRNMTAAAEAGAVVLPAAPGFYYRPRQISELVDFIVRASWTTSVSRSSSPSRGRGEHGRQELLARDVTPQLYRRSASCGSTLDRRGPARHRGIDRHTDA